MDLSFFSPPRWGGTGISRTLRQLAIDPWGDARGPLLLRLLEESPWYRHMLGDVFLDVWNYRVSVEFIDERIAHYADLARQLNVYTIEYFGGLEYYFARRLPWLARTMPNQLDMDLSKLHVISPASERVAVDGHPVASNFWGLYRRGDQLTLSVEKCQERLSHWLVNGRERRPGEPRIAVVAGDVREVRAVFRGPCPA
jgi:hypothetical protein